MQANMSAYKLKQSGHLLWPQWWFFNLKQIKDSGVYYTTWIFTGNVNTVKNVSNFNRKIMSNFYRKNLLLDQQ